MRFSFSSPGLWKHVSCFCRYHTLFSVIATALYLFFIPIFKWGRKYYVQTSCCGKTYKLDNEVGRAIEKGEPVVKSQNDLEYEGQTPVIKKCNYCGYVTEENFEYCPKCGNILN